MIVDVTVPAGGVSPGLELGASRGYDRVSAEECKVVDLVRHAADLPQLAARAEEAARDYRLVWWRDRAPDELVDDLCALRSAFLAEIPLEEIDLRPQTWTLERLRAVEDRNLALGLTELTVAAVAPDGRLAGFTDLHLAPAAPERAAIGHTLVLPPHRGRRLGLGLKVRLHQLVRELVPSVESVVTYNAGVNAHMNAVNELLGYEVRQHVIGLQKKL